MPLTVTYMTLPATAGGRRQNVGDRVIYLGVRNILRHALGPHESRTVDLSSDEPVPDGTDVLVVCGTPQIAHTRRIVDTVRRTAAAARSPVPVRINLGAGAFYFDAFGPDRAERDAAFAEQVRQGPSAATYARYAGFHLCVARDLAATAALRAVGVPAVPLPCPGFFSALLQPRPVLRHPRTLVSVLNGGASFWDRVAGDVHGFYERLHETRPDALFLAHDEEDREMLTDLGIPHLAFDDAEDLVAALAAHDRMLALRVHSALPAWSLGLDTTLLGLDRRALLGEDFGASFRVLPLREEEDFRRAAAAVAGARPAQDEATRAAWLARHLDLYAGAIRATVASVLGPLPEAGDGARPQLPAPATLAEKGRYWKRLFHSTDPAFAAPARLLRSQYPTGAESSTLAFETDGERRTLVFGPYLLIPRGRWRVRFAMAADPPPGTDLPQPYLTLSVMKGTAMEVLARRGITPEGAGAAGDFPLEFENPRDTGSVETIVRNEGPSLAPGWRFRVEPVRFERLD